MGSKSWIVILGLGVAAVVAMGLMTSYLVDNRPDLKAAIAFKAAFVEAFRDEGFEEVSLRRLPRRRGYQLNVARAPETSPSRAEALDRRIAEYFVERFDARSTGVLRLSYSAPRGFGCSRTEPYRENEISVRELRLQLADERKEEDVRSRLTRIVEIELTRFDREAGELSLDFRLSSRGRAPVATAEEALLEIATDVRRTVEEALRYRKLHLRIAAPTPVADEADGADGAQGTVRTDAGAIPAGPGATTRGTAREAWLLEVSFDARGRILPR